MIYINIAFKTVQQLDVNVCRSIRVLQKPGRDRLTWLWVWGFLNISLKLFPKVIQAIANYINSLWLAITGGRLEWTNLKCVTVSKSSKHFYSEFFVLLKNKQTKSWRPIKIPTLKMQSINEYFFFKKSERSVLSRAARVPLVPSCDQTHQQHLFSCLLLGGHPHPRCRLHEPEASAALHQKILPRGCWPHRAQA